MKIKYVIGNHPYYPSYKYFWPEITESFYKLWGKKIKRGGTRVLLEYQLNPNALTTSQKESHD